MFNPAPCVRSLPRQPQQATDQRVATLTEVAHFLGRDPSALSKLRDCHGRERQ